MDDDALIWGGLIVLIILVVAVVVWAAAKDSAEWEAFRTAHKCQVVGKTRGTSHLVTTFTGGKVGIGSVYEAEKVSWLCDDGITYTR